MKKIKQTIPKWFDGTVYEKGNEVQNPFSGEKYELNAIELSIYDFVIGSNMVLEMYYDNKTITLASKDQVKKVTRDLYKGLDWFRENNAKAYMVLLD